MNNSAGITNSIRAFSIAALVFGILALITFFTGILPLMAGGMGILFVALSYRKGSPLTPTARAGLYLSILGVLFGVLLLVYSYFAVVQPMMNDPEFYDAMNLYYQNNFGISLDEMWGTSIRPAN